MNSNMLQTAIFNDQKISIDEYNNVHKNLIHCECCGRKLVAKKGNIVSHHFAHDKIENCDSWYHGDQKTQWHINWQNIVKKEYTENIIIKNGIKHIADIINPFIKDKNGNSLVIEVQHSNLSKKEIEERENFYENMIWIIDLRGDPEFNRVCKRSFIYDTEIIKFCQYYFKHDCLVYSRKTYFRKAKKPVYLDTDFGFFKYMSSYESTEITCEFVNIEEFLDSNFSNVLKQPTLVYDKTYLYFSEKILPTIKTSNYLAISTSDNYKIKSILKYSGFEYYSSIKKFAKPLTKCSSSFLRELQNIYITYKDSKLIENLIIFWRKDCEDNLLKIKEITKFEIGHLDNEFLSEFYSQWVSINDGIWIPNAVQYIKKGFECENCKSKTNGFCHYIVFNDIKIKCGNCCTHKLVGRDFFKKLRFLENNYKIRMQNTQIYNNLYKLINQHRLSIKTEDKLNSVV